VPRDFTDLENQGDGGRTGGLSRVTSLTWDLGDTQTGRAGEGQGEPERDRGSRRGRRQTWDLGDTQRQGAPEKEAAT
jgi:hypothetical protein